MNSLKHLLMLILSLFTGGRFVRLLESDLPDGEQELHEGGGAVQDGTGTVWNATILKFGKSKRSPHHVYTREAMERSLPAFAGAKVYANRISNDYGHKNNRDKSSRDIVGFLSNPTVTDTALVASVNIMPSANWLRQDLLFASEKKRLDVYQLSIDGGGVVTTKEHNGERLPVVEAILTVDVDIVPQAAAGGAFNNLVESFNRNTSHKFTEGVTAMKQKLLAFFTMLYPTFLESKGVRDFEKIDENQLFTYLLEADKPQPVMKLPDGAQLTESLLDDTLKRIRESFGSGGATPPGSEDPAKKAAADAAAAAAAKEGKSLKESLDAQQTEIRALRIESAGRMLESMLVKSGLPVPLKEAIADNFKGKVFTEAEAASYIKTQRETYAKLFPSDVHVPIIEGGMDQLDKIQLGLDGLFLADPNALKPLSGDERKAMLKGVAPMRSVREGYVLLTGDVDVTGQRPKNQRFTESLATSDWTKIFGDALNKRLVRDYQMMNLDGWKSFVDIVPLKNFMTQHRIRYGGYANLPTVGQRAPYLPLTSPSDEEATYTPAKRGGTEDITIEMIANDDVGSITKIPTRMARSAAQTLHEFVFDFIKPSVNPTLYDSVALYHSTHANTATTALGTDGVALAAARLRMKKQSMAGSSKRLGIRAGILAVPSDLEEAAYKNLTPAFAKSNAVPEFYQQLGIAPLVVDYWTDATDWVLIARREDVVGIEVGFLNGQETPELYVSDMQNVGSLFTNDVVTYKIRHIYGGQIIDFRAFDGSIVA